MSWEYGDAVINWRVWSRMQLLTKRFLSLLALTILGMQLLIADGEQIALKIQNNILHSHGQEDEHASDDNKSNKEQSQWQFWTERNNHC